MPTTVLIPPELDHPDAIPEGVHAEILRGNATESSVLEATEFYAVPFSFSTEPAQLTSHMPKLRAVQALTAGVDNVLPYVRDEVSVCNARGVHDVSTAELALTLILSSLRGIPDAVHNKEEHRWSKARRPSVAGKRVLLIGYGSIGRAIADLLHAFHAEVVPVARSARDGVHAVDELPQLLPAADIVVLIMPGSSETTHMVDAQFLASMKDGALLVNVSRGSVVSSDALIPELNSGRLHAAVDVMEGEPLEENHPLWKCPNLLITPHEGGNTDIMWPTLRRFVHGQIQRFMDGAPLENVVRER